jgi:putative phosphoesterase
VHAGDFSVPEVLAELEAIGPPVAAVCGNVDAAELRVRLPERRVLEVDGVRIGVVHDAGPALGRPARLRRAFPDVQAVVFGHSHIPLSERAPDGFAIFNPGSPTERRRQPRPTMGTATVRDGAIAFEIVAL